jgi:hypothetical protein
VAPDGSPDSSYADPFWGMCRFMMIITRVTPECGPLVMVLGMGRELGGETLISWVGVMIVHHFLKPIIQEKQACETGERINEDRD